MSVTTRAAVSAAEAAMLAGVSIRPLAGEAEYRASRKLSFEVWGADFADAVPPGLLWVAQRNGGIASGAFEADGRLVGFIFGLTGLRDGGLVHWSDIMGVLPEWRGRGVGIALKLHQRELLLALGVTLVQWTFEPLEARNAYINFERLGITAREYLRDVYAASDSALHAGLGTDRLVAEWRLDSERVRAATSTASPARSGAGVVSLNDVAFEHDWPRSSAPDLARTEPRLLLHVPGEIQALKVARPQLAQEWRAHTRAAFEHYLGNGWVVQGVVREGKRSSAYLLEREV